MLHLSLLTLPRGSMKWRFLQQYELHQVIWKAFPGLPRGLSEGRFLYRCDEYNDLYSVLVQSTLPPDWRFLDDESDGTTAQVKSFDPERLDVGSRLRFFLRANPVVNRRGYEGVDKHGEEQHRRIAVGSDRRRMAERLGVEIDTLPSRDEQLAEWFGRKGKEGGFEMLEVVPGPNHDVVIRAGRSRTPMTFTTVDFDGVLLVTDRQAFARTLRQGIGRGKGFGFGLLSVKRID